MKKKFHGYYPASDGDAKAIVADAIVTVDACSLLNVYSYSSEAADEFLKQLEQLNDRVWIPYQAASEFHKNRLSRLARELKFYENVTSQIERLRKDFESPRQHPFLSAAVMNEFSNVTAKIEKELQAGRKAHEGLTASDPLAERIALIFEDRVGAEFTAAELSAIYDEGKLRYEKRIPPGFNDREKDVPERYGDLVIWKELIAHAKKSEKDLVFITSDGKQDWWLRQSGKTIGPLPLLRQEFHSESGQQVAIYKPERFMEIAAGPEVSSDVIDEIRHVSQAEPQDDGVLMRVKLDGDSLSVPTPEELASIRQSIVESVAAIPRVRLSDVDFDAVNRMVIASRDVERKIRESTRNAIEKIISSAADTGVEFDETIRQQLRAINDDYLEASEDND